MTTACLFLKAPRAGTVKTRLARDIGADRALAVYRALVERQAAALPPAWSVVVSFAPHDALEEMESWLRPRFPQGVRFEPQCDGDLGDRLASAVQREFLQCGATRLFLLGGDCPQITADYLHKAEASLETHDMAVGPAQDGGYVLLGLRSPLTALFENITWSTPVVLAQTLAVAKHLSLSIATLPTLEDVDNLESLERQNHAFLTHAAGLRKA
ncbi:hypothetical protein DB346_10150 [Verrucomicrobia bacterium LW23]|nr:hypothetical protein DB346_10150 [Verrucomicrobia bacterium LW23]